LLSFKQSIGWPGLVIDGLGGRSDQGIKRNEVRGEYNGTGVADHRRETKRVVEER